jgi:dephospho-CoA kinase
MLVSTAAPRGPAVAVEATGDHAVEAVSPLSKELVIGLVGYAGAGCSTAARRLQALLDVAGYTVHRVQLSRLIHKKINNAEPPFITDGPRQGIERFGQATALQDLGDTLRRDFGSHAVATLGIKEIISLRGASDHGTAKIAFLLDSIKHRDEVNLLRRVYDSSFRLVAVHCERTTREGRLIGDRRSVSKYRGAPERDVLRYMDRDEKDVGNLHGQQVRDAFYLADYFIDNNVPTQDGQRLNGEL